MAYKLSLDDFDEGAPPKKEGHQLSLDDFDSVEKDDFYKKMRESVTHGLNRESKKDFDKQFQNIIRSGSAGVIKTGEGIEELAAKGLRPIAEKLGLPIVPLEESVGYQEVEKTINELYPKEVSSTPEGKISYALGQGIPTALLPIRKGGAIVKAIKAAAQSEALSPIFNPEKSLKDAYIEGIEPSAGVGALTAALGLPRGIGKALRMGGRATTEEFERNVISAGDKPIGVGSLSRAPMLSWAEQQGLANVPFTGQAQKNMQVGEMLDREVGHVLNDLNIIPEEKPRYRATGNPNEPFEAIPMKTQTHKIAENLQENVDKNQIEKRRLYGLRDKIAQSLAIKVKPTQVADAAKEELETIKGEMSRKGKTNFSPEVVKDLKAMGMKSFDRKGKEIDQSIPFNEINFETGGFGEKARIAKREGRTNDQRVYEKLERALKSDMHDAIEKSGSQELKQAQYQADKHYQQKIAPIMENDKLREHALGLANKDKIISDFLKTGTYDNPTELHALLKNLDPDYRKQLAHEFLTRGLKELEGKEEIKSDAVLSLYNKLGNETKRLLFSPTQRNLLDRAWKARDMMGGNINQMIHPKTGYTHGKLAGIAASVGTAGGSAALGRLLSTYLTSSLAKSTYRLGSKLSSIPNQSYINPVALSPLMQGEGE